jgi:hypothetical protein
MLIGEIQKGTDKIMVTVKEFKGKTYVDIRTYFENDQGEMVPTKKGVSFSPENLDEILKILKDAQARIKGQGEAKQAE